MAQTYAYPTTDTIRDNWTEFDGTTTSIYEQIDDVTADDTNFICTIVSPVSDVYVTKFNTLTETQAVNLSNKINKKLNSKNYTLAEIYNADEDNQAESLNVTKRLGFASAVS